MSIRGTTVTGTILIANSPNLPPQKYGYMQTFLVRHALSFPNGGLAIARHNGIRDKIIHLVRQAFSPSYIGGKILIHLGHSILEEEVHQEGSVL